MGRFAGHRCHTVRDGSWCTFGIMSPSSQSPRRAMKSVVTRCTSKGSGACLSWGFFGCLLWLLFGMSGDGAFGLFVMGSFGCLCSVGKGFVSFSGLCVAYFGRGEVLRCFCYWILQLIYGFIRSRHHTRDQISNADNYVLPLGHDIKISGHILHRCPKVPNKLKVTILPLPPYLFYATQHT